MLFVKEYYYGKEAHPAANYNVMNEEEMTYTSGGDGFTAPFAVGWTIGAVISVANLIWGLDQTRT